MKAKIRIFLFSFSFLMAASGMIAQAQTGGQEHITNYPDFDTKYIEPNINLYNTGSGEELVQATFCSDQTVVLDATEFGTEAVYGSYKWFRIDPYTGTETDLGVDTQVLNYTSSEPGFHLFRVEGYSEPGQLGCYEITEVAVYVLPEIALTEPVETFEYCETDLPPNDPASSAENSFGIRHITLDADIIDETSFPDTYEYRYQWNKTAADNTKVPITGATASTYTVGSLDDHNEVGVWEYSVEISYEVNDGGCLKEFIMTTITVTAAPEKPVINISGGHSRQP